MKNILYLLCALFLFSAADEAMAQDRPFGLGIMFGEPTGLSAKLWTSGNTAFDFGLGWSFFDNQFNNDHNSSNYYNFHMDFLWHSFNAISSTERFPLYYGLGGRVRGKEGYESSLAARGVLGVAWLPRNTSIDIFFEVAPSLELTPSSGFGLDAAVGLRYFF